MTLRASIVIDYQNVHLTAFDVFNRRGERHDSLIHPVLFARRAIAERNGRQRAGYTPAEANRVLVFRGLPHVDHDWEQHRRCLDQKAAWERAGAEVHLRALKYDFERDFRRRPILDVYGKKVPTGRPREKGIDVLCALACVREAARDDVDIVILASRDTDLVPALDEVHDLNQASPERYARIETASWHNHDAKAEGNRHLGSLRATAPRRIWNTNLNRACYEASIDRNDYR